MNADFYKTIEKQGEAEFIEKRSRFIGHALPVTTEREALSFLEKLRSEYWDASHNVFAYSLRNGQLRRFSDDGEPQGTAGIPTLEVLTKGELIDAVIVVTRYFGGILLGAGGLVRAYSHTARLAVEAAGVVTMKKCKTAVLHCDYNQYGRLAALIPSIGGAIDQTDFADDVFLTFHLPTELTDGFDKKLADLTCGSIAAEYTGEIYLPFL